MSETPPLVELRDVTRRFPGRGEAPPVDVLCGASLRVEAGTSLAICGPSGSGKSTLLNLIGVLDRPTQGAVLFEGRDLATLGAAEQTSFRNAHVGFVFQLHHLLPQCTALENVLLPAMAAGRGDGGVDATRRARELLGRVGLGERLDYMPGQLSGGEQQRVAVVRALINTPSLLLADEPTGALDDETSEQVLSILEALRQEEGAALIIVTHSDMVAARMERRVVLREGKLNGKVFRA